MKKKEVAIVRSNVRLTDDIMEMHIACDAAKSAKPGQFVNLFVSDGAHLLPRPISICRIDEIIGELVLVYRIVGQGTEAFSKLEGGSVIEVVGPLGNGFETKAEGRKALIVGGGVGIPPMLGLAERWDGEAEVVLGYRDEAFLDDEFEKCHFPIHISSDAGTVGQKGTVLDVIRGEELKADVIFACGPKPMLAALKAYAIEKDIPCYVSMEERMACGIGVCLGCVCESTAIDEHSKVHNKRVCKDGPVFEAREVEL